MVHLLWMLLLSYSQAMRGETSVHFAAATVMTQLYERFSGREIWLLCSNKSSLHTAHHVLVLNKCITVKKDRLNDLNSVKISPVSCSSQRLDVLAIPCGNLFLALI